MSTDELGDGRQDSAPFEVFSRRDRVYELLRQHTTLAYELERSIKELLIAQDQYIAQRLRAAQHPVEVHKAAPNRIVLRRDDAPMPHPPHRKDGVDSPGASTEDVIYCRRQPNSQNDRELRPIGSAALVAANGPSLPDLLERGASATEIVSPAAPGNGDDGPCPHQPTDVVASHLPTFAPKDNILAILNRLTNPVAITLDAAAVASVDNRKRPAAEHLPHSIPAKRTTSQSPHTLSAQPIHNRLTHSDVAPGTVVVMGNPVPHPYDGSPREPLGMGRAAAVPLACLSTEPQGRGSRPQSEVPSRGDSEMHGAHSIREHHPERRPSPSPEAIPPSGNHTYYIRATNDHRDSHGLLKNRETTANDPTPALTAPLPAEAFLSTNPTYTAVPPPMPFPPSNVVPFAMSDPSGMAQSGAAHMPPSSIPRGWVPQPPPQSVGADSASCIASLPVSRKVNEHLNGPGGGGQTCSLGDKGIISRRQNHSPVRQEDLDAILAAFDSNIT